MNSDHEEKKHEAPPPSAFAPQQSTAHRLGKLQANPIDIYSAAPVRNYDFVYSWGAAVLDYFALPIVELSETPDI